LRTEVFALEVRIWSKCDQIRTVANLLALREQVLLVFEEIEVTLADNAPVVGNSTTLRDNQARRHRARHGRLPAHLRRAELVLAPEAMAVQTFPRPCLPHSTPPGSASQSATMSPCPYLLPVANRKMFVEL